MLNSYLMHRPEVIEVKDNSLAAHLLDKRFDLELWLQHQVLKMAPIWLASVALHILLIIVLSLISVNTGKIPDKGPEMVVDLHNDIPLIPPEEIKPVYTDQKDIVPEKPDENVDNRDDNPEPDTGNNDEIDIPSPKVGTDTTGIGRQQIGKPKRGRPTGRGGIPITRTEDAVLSGLIWLGRHQNPDGSWSAHSFMNHCTGVRCSSIGDEAYNIGLTALAMLAFTGAGYTTFSKDAYEGVNFGEVVRKAADYLVTIQDSHGVYGGIKEGKFMYNQAIAAYAMADLYGLIKDTPTGNIYRDAAQKGIDYLISAQNPGFGWRYQPRDGQNDSSVTGWAAMAIKSAHLAELKVPGYVFDNIRSFYDSVTEQTNGRVGYTEIGSVAIGIKEQARNPVIQPSLTAIGVMVRIFMDKKVSDPVIKKGVELIMQSLPAWDTGRLGIIDYYYWFYASYCLNQFDGPDGPSWKKWNERMKEVLLKSQHVTADGCVRGSWDPIDRWGDEGGRIYATAINVLTLEVYYRLGITRLNK